MMFGNKFEIRDIPGSRRSLEKQLNHIDTCVNLLVKNDAAKGVSVQEAITPALAQMDQQFQELYQCMDSYNHIEISSFLRTQLLTDFRATRTTIINAIPADAFNGDLRREVAEATKKIYTNFKGMKEVLHDHLDDVVNAGKQIERPRSCVIVW